MRTHLLIYDDNCPLCVCYTGAFVRWGLLKAAERQPFSTATDEWLQKIDMEKAKNEIPYIDLQSGQVVYGIDAMLEILKRKLPFVKPIGKWPPVYWMLRRLYQFISFNRKVIVAKRCGSGAIDCEPAFSCRWRWIFMLVFLTLNTLLLFPVHDMLLRSIPGYNLSAAQLQACHAGLVLSNSSVAFFLGWRKATEYLGQINILAIITMFFLSMYAFLLQWVQVPVPVTIGFLAALLLLVATEYARRMHYLRLAARETAIISINLVSLLLFLILLFI